MRSLRRRWVARDCPATRATGACRGRAMRPERLVLRLDAHPPETGLAARVDQFVEAVAWLGPLPVSVIAPDLSPFPWIADLVRVAHRLGSPVRLCGAARGLVQEVAEALARAGLDELRIPLGGLDPLLHADVVGAPLDLALEGIRSLLAARDAAAPRMDVCVALPVVPLPDGGLVGLRELRALEGWARQVDVDGLVVLPPLRAPGRPRELPVELLGALRQIEGSRDPFHRTQRGCAAAVEAVWGAGDGQPGRPRSGGSCPVGGLRMEIRATGVLLACPFLHPSVCFRPGRVGLAKAWASGGAHRESIRGCSRSCWLPDLDTSLALFPGRAAAATPEHETPSPKEVP
jgi:hypothetical protein